MANKPSRDGCDTLNQRYMGANSMEKRKAVVITVSDSSYHRQREDVSGPALATLVTETGFEVTAAVVLPDERETLANAMKLYAARLDVQFIATTGGTGLSKRDVTPEATLDVIDRVIPGMAEAMRMKSLETTPFAMTSRQVAGMCNETLIVNFPGSPKAVAECFGVVRGVLHHIIDLASGHTEH